MISALQHIFQNHTSGEGGKADLITCKKAVTESPNQIKDKYAQDVMQIESFDIMCLGGRQEQCTADHDEYRDTESEQSVIGVNNKPLSA